MTMTEAPPTQSNQRTGSAVPSLSVERRRGRLGNVGVGQIVAIEVAALAVAATLGRPVWLRAGAGIAALILLLAMFARRDGRWWYESVRVRRRFHRRARTPPAIPTGADPVTAGLARLAPGLTAVDVVDRRTRFGVGQDAGGFFVVLEVMPWRDGDGRRRGELSLDALADLLASTTVPLSALQVVIHVVPVPTGVLDWRAPCSGSYLELVGDALVPADQRVWVVGRLSPADARAAAASRGGGVPGVHRALAAAVGRLDKVLQAGGVPARALDAVQLTSALAMAVDTPADRSTAGPDAASSGREEWRAWQTAEATHVGFTLTELPRRPLPEFIWQLSRQRVLSAAMSIVLTPRGDHEVCVEALLRISARPEAADETVRKITELCRTAGAKLRRLDGEHAVAVYAAAPTGGGAP